MIVVDTALAARAGEDRPVEVAMIGAGFMARGIALQIAQAVPGMRLAVVFARDADKAERVYREAGLGDMVRADDLEAVDRAIARRQPVVVTDPSLAVRARGVEVVLEATGTVEFAAGVVLEAIEAKRSVVLMNAELDGTVGPILKSRADRVGVLYSGCDGDQPGVEMNLHRYVKSIGLRPLVCGNIKGLQDPYRNPTTQAEFAKRWKQEPYMVTSFADGTKISFEQAIVANATGMQVARRGMYGHERREHVDDLTGLYDLDELESLGGIVDYVIGAQPAAGVFVYGRQDDPVQRHYLEYYKRGEGPLYSFYTPYHICHFEVPLSLARVALLDDPVITPLGPPRVDVITLAKRDLKAGEVLDGIGWYATYGQCENSPVAHAEGLLPMGLAAGCRMRRDLPRDTPLTYDDVELPPDRVSDRLRAEQDAEFFG